MGYELKKSELENMQIKYIGDELKFQRLYYNNTHSTKIELGDKNSQGKYRVLGEELAEYLYENNIITEEKNDGISDKVLRSIEENNYKIYPTCKNNKSSVYDPSKHFFEMFYMLKIYGYLDDYDIFKLFKKYDVLGELEKMRKDDEILSKNKEILLKRIEEHKQNCRLEYKDSNLKIAVSLMFPMITTSVDDIKDFLQENLINMKILSNEKYLEKNAFNPRKKIIPIGFPEFRKIMLENFKNLSKFERKCISLEIGKETGFIDNVLNNRISYVTLETLKNILKYLNLKDSDMYYFINKRIEKETYFPENKKLNIFQDI